MGLTINVEGLTLSNLGGADLEEQFQDALRQLAEAFVDEEGKYGKQGSIKAKLSIAVDFEHSLESRTTMCKTTMTLAVPKYRKVLQPLMLNTGRFLVEPDDSGRQLDLTRHGHSVDLDPIPPNRPLKQD